MKCNKCPLFRSWNNENDRGESCGLFGDGWDSNFQYENKDGDIIGCYIEKAYIDKIYDNYTAHLDEIGNAYKEIYATTDDNEIDWDNLFC